MQIIDHDAERRAAIYSDISRTAFVCFTLALAIVTAFTVYMFGVAR